jgi:hypothetical protein
LANKSQARLCSESLQSALEQNLNGPGSMIYQTVWKPHTTPLGRQIYRLRASARRTSDSEHSLVPSGWATPVGQQANGTPDAFLERKRKSMANGSQSMGVCLSDLNMQVQAWAGWTTPQAHDPSPRGSGQKLKHGTKHGCADLNADAALSGWPTPEAEEARRGYQNRSNGKKGSQKSMTTAVINALGDKPHLTPHGAARITADGTMLTGCSAGMESGGQLNPAFSGWLMGFPEAWCHAAISCQLPARLRKAPKKPAA